MGVGMNDWIGPVLRALGNHIRYLEDENASHRAFREADREQIRGLADTVERTLAGSPDEALVLELNEKIHTIRCWVSWAGQARMFRRDVMALLHNCFFDKSADQRNVAEFVTRVRDGAYDVIQMPGDTSAEPISINRAGGGAPPLAEADEREGPQP